MMEWKIALVVPMRRTAWVKIVAKDRMYISGSLTLECTVVLFQLTKQKLKCILVSHALI